MNEVRKKVYIEGDASGIVEAFNQVGTTGNVVYDRLKKDAESYSDNLKEQAVYVERMIALEQKRATEYNKNLQQQLELEKEERLKGAGSARDKFVIERDYDDRIERAKRYSLIERQQLIEAKQLADTQFGDARFRRVSDFEDEQQINPNDPRFRRMAQRTRYMLGSGAGAVMSGLGIGFAMGFVGILYEMVKESNVLDKSMAQLRATMSEVDKSSLGAGASIGKTSSEMAQLTRQFAMMSGGELGALTGNRALGLAQFAKAFGVEENLLLQTLPIGRMGGADIGKELLDLLREMLRTGTVTNTDMSKLTEKIEYWSRLNEMQSQQLLNVAPGASTFILGAMEKTGLPILSDQRQMDFIEKINRSITNPGNEFVRAYNISALGQMTGGNVFETLKLEEQGIFGKGVMRTLFEQWQRDFAGADIGMASIGMSTRFGLGLQESEMLMKNLFANTPEAKERMNALLESFDKMSQMNEDYTKAMLEGDKEKKSRLQNEFEISRRKLFEEYGINVPQLAGANTGISDAVLATYKNIMAKNGSDVLKSMGSLLLNPDVTKAVDSLSSGISYVASETIKLAGEVIIKAAQLFNDAVKTFGTAVDAFTKEGRTVDVLGNVIPKELVQTSGQRRSAGLTGGFGILGDLFTNDATVATAYLKDYYARGFFQKEIASFFKGKLSAEGDLLETTDEQSVINYFEKIQRNVKGISSISDLYGFQNMNALPQSIREKIKNFTHSRIKDGKIIDSDFDEYEDQTMKKLLEEIFLNYYQTVSPKNKEGRWGADKYKERIEGFKDLPVQAGKGDTSSLLNESMKDLAKVLRDNVNELKRNNFTIPGIYSEAYVG